MYIEQENSFKKGMWIDVEVVCYGGVSCSLAQNWDNLWGKEKFCGWLRFRLC